MEFCDSCKNAIQSCMNTQTFAVARLYNTEKTMNIHIHDCYEIYYSISGGKQFLIDHRFYDFKPGDLFLINQYESHFLSQIDSVTHERIVFSIHPEYLKKCSTDATDLNLCFSDHNTRCGHKLSLSAEEQKRFLYYVHKLSNKETFGQDLMDHAIFLELMVFLNKTYYQHNAKEMEPLPQNGDSKSSSCHEQIDNILSYVNQHLTENLTLQKLADHFYLSTSYLCKIFKQETGTTINRYITAKRITLAKSLLAEGNTVTDVCNQCGFNDYSNFLKTFTKAVGISPKKYAQFEL